MITASDFEFQTSGLIADSHPLPVLVLGLYVVTIPFLRSNDYDCYDVSELMESPGVGPLDSAWEAGFEYGSIR